VPDEERCVENGSTQKVPEESGMKKKSAVSMLRIADWDRGTPRLEKES